MLEASKHINAAINGNPAISALLPGGCSWELAPETVVIPFAVYSVTESPGPTKDSFGSYRLSIFIFSKSLTNGAEIADQVIDNVPQHWRHELTQSGYTASDAKEAYIEVIFNFKM